MQASVEFSHMTSSTGKKRGPKPKVRAPKDAIEQLSLRITRTLKTALELVARDLRMSVNETITYLLQGALTQHDLDGKSAYRIADIIESFEGGFTEPSTFDAHDGIERTPEEARKVLAHFSSTTGVFRAMFTPDRLRTAEERYLLSVWECEGPAYWTEGETLAEVVKWGFLENRDPADVALTWRKMAAAKIKAAKSARKAK